MAFGAQPLNDDVNAAQIADARASGLLFSLHLKATMMKVSDPIIFGHAVRAYFKPVFTKHAATLERIGVDVKNGFGDLVAKIATLPEAERAAIEADIQAVYAHGPAIAMVDSDKGITNLHVPSDVIVDASMPAMLREGGKMWNAAGKTQDVVAVIPDRSYAGIYQAVIDFCRTHGIDSVLVEGGGKVLSWFIKNDLADRCIARACFPSTSIFDLAK
jgi:isocitrate dehydrogenase